MTTEWSLAFAVLGGLAVYELRVIIKALERIWIILYDRLPPEAGRPDDDDD